MNKIDKLKEIIETSDNIVFFGGAGVSVASNIPDFRSSDGLYQEKGKFNPEEILSRTFFLKNTVDFYKFYFSKMIYKDAKPNNCHRGLKRLEDLGKLKAVITQNIDGLHQEAGSKEVLELHGSVYRNYCLKCRKSYDLDFMVKSVDIPICECGGILKPDVVLYEEELDNSVIEKAVNYIKNADCLIIGGTSLTVFPATGLIEYFNGKHLVIINKSPTPYDSRCDLVINKDIDKVFKEFISYR